MVVFRSKGCAITNHDRLSVFLFPLYKRHHLEQRSSNSFFKKQHESGASALKKYIRYAQLSNEEMELSGLENTWKDIRPLENTSYGKD